MSDVVLVLNCGSSSVKFALYDPQTETRLVSGLAERVGTPEATATIKLPDSSHQIDDLGSGDHTDVLRSILHELGDWLDANGHRITAVGHRIVHGGEKFSSSVVLDDAALEAVRACVPLAPLHNPANIAGIEAATAVLPDVPQVGVFDTAFHQSMPPVAYRYAVPHEWYADYNVRRYGFHGTSHRYVSEKVAELVGKDLRELRVVTAHLGNGASVAALREGKSVDTSMGLTPLEGLVMGTRSGDIDPGIGDYINSRTGDDVKEITLTLNKRGGLLGLSEVSNDLREVTKAADEGDENAALAIDVFNYRLAKYIAGICVPLGGIDVLVFTGGIGENAPRSREKVLGLLGFLGFETDSEANSATRGTAGLITTGQPGKPQAVVMPTDEELVIARDAFALSNQSERPDQQGEQGQQAQHQEEAR